MVNSTNFQRPSLKQIRDRVIATINAKIPETDALLRNSVLNVLSCVLADMSNEFYGYMEYIAKQIFPDTADDRQVEHWGAIWGVDRKLASFATGKVTITGVVGSSISSGTRLKRSDGKIYLTKGIFTIPVSGLIDIDVKSENVGLDANAKALTKLSLLSPVAGISSDAFVNSDGLTGGAEIENLESYTNRILLRMQEPPRGGSKTDYEHWAMEVSGVTRAWCVPLIQGAGTVGLRFMMDDTYEDGIPLSGDVKRVEDYINAPNRKPVPADLYVLAPLAHKVDVAIENLSPNTTDVQEAIKAGLKELFSQETSPGSTVYISKIWEAVSVAVGAEHFKLVSPSENILLPDTTIAVLGEISFGGGNG